MNDLIPPVSNRSLKRGNADWRHMVAALLVERRRLTQWERDWLTRLWLQETITAREQQVLTAIMTAAHDGPQLPFGTTAAWVDGVPGLVYPSPVLPNGRSSSPRFTPASDLPTKLRRLVLTQLSAGSREA